MKLHLRVKLLPKFMLTGLEVPLWVNALWWILQQLDYKLASPASRLLATWRIELVNRYCQCEKCQRLRREEERWAE